MLFFSYVQGSKYILRCEQNDLLQLFWRNDFPQKRVELIVNLVSLGGGRGSMSGGGEAGIGDGGAPISSTP